MGAFGTWELAARFPERFAAVVPISGVGDEQHAARLVGVPLWAIHGEADAVVPVESSRSMIFAVERAGGSPHYSELPGIGHNPWRVVMQPDFEVLRWMFGQSRGSAIAQTN